MDSLKALFDLTKLPTKFFFLFAITSGFILFADDEILKAIQLTKLKENHGWIIGLVFIFSTGLVFVNVIIGSYNFIRNSIRFRKSKKEFKERVSTLDDHEKSVVREFYLNGQSSMEMPIDDPVITGLLDKRILIINKQFGTSFIMNGSYAPVSLDKFAEKIMEAKDIDLSEEVTEEELIFAKRNRPKWVHN